jgi:hypothetical protein
VRRRSSTRRRGRRNTAKKVKRGFGQMTNQAIIARATATVYLPLNFALRNQIMARNDYDNAHSEVSDEFLTITQAFKNSHQKLVTCSQPT